MSGAEDNGVPRPCEAKVTTAARWACFHVALSCRWQLEPEGTKPNKSQKKRRKTCLPAPVSCCFRTFPQTGIFRPLLTHVQKSVAVLMCVTLVFSGLGDVGNASSVTVPNRKSLSARWTIVLFINLSNLNKPLYCGSILI